MSARDNVVSLLDWAPVSRAMPDDDETVLVYAPEADPQVWPGYHDGDDGWRYAEGTLAPGVTHWAPMPAGPQ